MILRFDKMKINKVSEFSSLRNVWRINYRNCENTFFTSRYASKIITLIKDQFPACHITDELTLMGIKIHVSLNDVDEAFFMLWASGGLEI